MFSEQMEMFLFSHFCLKLLGVEQKLENSTAAGLSQCGKQVAVIIENRKFCHHDRFESLPFWQFFVSEWFFPFMIASS
jgi:hypothetical protein